VTADADAVASAAAHAHFGQGSPARVRYARAVGLLRADTDGLGVLADRCEALAGALSSSVAPSVPPLSGQATSAAVNRVHSNVGATATALAARTDMTAAKLTAAAAAYTHQDTSSASDLDAAAESVQVVEV
jgi:hypothetical protein